MPISKKLLQLYDELEGPLHQAIENSHRKVSCTKGCTHCCYMMTLCGVQEGLLIADKVMGSMKWKHYVRELRKSATVMSKSNQTEYFQMRRPCVFLSKEGLCEVYDARPSACRFYYVVSPAEDCSPDKNGKSVLSVNTSIQESTVWKFEIDNSPSGQPIFAPLPLMVIHSCLVAAMELGHEEKAKYVKRHLSGLIDPITWLETINLQEMSRNHPDTIDEYKKAGALVGL